MAAMAVFPIIAAMALGSTGAEPVVWTRMADPDPNYVAPKPSAKSRSAKAARPTSEPTDMVGALVNLMRAGQEAQAAAISDYERKMRAAQPPVEESSAPQR